MVQYITLGFAILAAVLAGVTLYKQHTSMKSFLKTCDPFAKATADIQIVADAIAETFLKKSEQALAQVTSDIRNVGVEITETFLSMSEQSLANTTADLRAVGADITEAFLKKSEWSLAKATADMRVIGADITEAAKKASKTVNRQICSKCGKKSWEFNEYADDRIICLNCENRMVTAEREAQGSAAQ
jgi:uncharacterized alpha-E superfamily protein/DNA-directed RNA polymerase subunit RPC12/RpoP